MNFNRSTVKDVIRRFRDNFLYVFIGTNRTGKSITARKQVIAWKKANPNKLVFGFDPQRRFNPNDKTKGDNLFDVVIGPEDKLWAVQMCKRRDCLLVIDDFNKLNDGNNGRPPEGFKMLMYDRCDYNIDMMFIFHNPSEVLNCVSDYATHYFIFFTNAKEGKFKDKIPNYQDCIIASHEVNEYVKLFGKGDYQRGGVVVCDFPYVWINCETGTLSAINMSRSMSRLSNKK